MKKCKKCMGTEFGVDLIEVRVTPAKTKDGEIVEVYKDPVVQTEVKHKYCFNCNIAIGEADLKDYIFCDICGEEVEDVTDGFCQECLSKQAALDSLSKQELILKYLKENIQNK